MRNAIVWVIGALPLDARGRRVLDEAIADWRQEAEEASGPWHRATRDAVSLLALARALIALTAHEAIAVPPAWILGRFVPLIAALSAALLWIQGGRLVTPYAGHVLELLASLAPSAVTFALPWAVLFAAATTHERRCLPVFGLAAWMLVASVMLGGWIVPLANQHFREVRSLSLLHVRASDVLRGPAELTLPELARAVRTAPSGDHGAAAQALARAALVLACPAFLYLAAAIRRLPVWPRGLAVVLTPIAYVLGSATLHVLNSGFVLSDPAWFVVASLIPSAFLTQRLNQLSGFRGSTAPPEF